jgi:hypothetical protein
MAAEHHPDGRVTWPRFGMSNLAVTRMQSNPFTPGLTAADCLAVTGIKIA